MCLLVVSAVINILKCGYIITNTDEMYDVTIFTVVETGFGAPQASQTL
jgi:hypothetical protein